MTIGPTGEFPEGKISEADEGELAIGIAVDHEDKLIRAKFGKKIAWMAFPPPDARNIGQLLIDKAIKLTGTYMPSWKASGVMSFYREDTVMQAIEVGIFEGQVRIDFKPEITGFSASGISMILLANTIIRKAAEIDGQIYTIAINSDFD